MSSLGRVIKTLLVVGTLAGPLTVFASTSSAQAGGQFTNTLLISRLTPPSGITTQPHRNSTGNSEPAIAFSRSGKMAVDGLAWLPFQVNLWRGSFGSTPRYFGAMDTDLQNKGAGRTTLGDGDADVEFTSAGTLLLADLDLVVNHHFNAAQLGVNVTRCPAGVTNPGGCQHIFLDTSGADRPWLTTAGRTAWVAYHDAGNSTLIRVQRSTDDGRTWRNVASPIPGQGRATGDATFNNEIGPIVADAGNGMLYEPFLAGEPKTKAKSANYNNVFVSRSTDGGRKWTSVQVFHAPPFTGLNNIFPALAVDPITHRIYTAWTDQHGVWLSASGNRGLSWTAPRLVSNITTTIEPWIAARKGKVDVVYYGSTAGSIDDSSAVWNVYDSQRLTGTWTVKRVSNTPNRIGAVCLEGSACRGDRELLDLFEVAEDPTTGKAAVIYTDTTVDTWSSGGTTNELPEIVLAFER